MAKLIAEIVDLAQYMRGRISDFSPGATRQPGVIARHEEGDWWYYLPKPKVVSEPFSVPRGWRSTGNPNGPGPIQGRWNIDVHDPDHGGWVRYVREDED